jgi:hypothetical protein
VECLNYDHTLDRCSLCLSGGRCLKGDLRRSNDFLCLCPACHSGRYCQFNSKSFTLTLDQLFHTDLNSIHKQKISYSIIISSLLTFLLAIPNNLFSFVTFRRQQCLRTGVGHYLLYISVINQISIGLLSARLIHLSVMMSFPQPFSTMENVLCKVFSYLLTCSTRVTSLFSSFVALERLYITIFLNGQWFTQPRIARHLMAITLATVLLSNVYELVFVRLFVAIDDDGNSRMCVLEFPIYHQSIWASLHQIFSIIYFILPLLINLCCTIVIMCIITKNKINIGMAKKSKRF